MNANVKEIITSVVQTLLIAIIFYVCGHIRGYNSGQHQGIELGIDATLDSVQAIINRTAVDSSVYDNTPDTTYTVSTDHVTHITIALRDTTSYFLSRQTIKP